VRIIGEPIYWSKTRRRVYKERLECGHVGLLRDSEMGPRRRKCHFCIGRPLRSVVALEGRVAKELGA
jgi:hypothetical protein